MRDSFLLMWRTLVRGHVLTLLLLATSLVHFLGPALVRSDGTADGWREMFVRAVPGSVYALALIALLACACGALAQEREQNRLALTTVRPVSAFAVVLGKLLAFAAIAALVLVFNSSLLLLRGGWTRCRHVFTPDLPPVAQAAQAALADYLGDERTPEAVKKAPRHAVLSLLANKELDRYDAIPAGETRRWPFRLDESVAAVREGRRCSVRVRFATQFDTRSSVSGEFVLGDLKGSVSNCTQSVIEVPLDEKGKSSVDSATGLGFENSGRTTVMLRPRRDLEILVDADSFGANLFRATAEMISVAVFLCAFGLFLSAALSRPVALFTAFVAMLVVEISPGVVAQFPDALEVAFTDRLGLWISRAVNVATSSITEASPLSDLATGTCVEWARLVRSVLMEALCAPIALLAAAAFLIRRRALR